MSAVLHAFKIPKGKLWELQRELRSKFPDTYRELFPDSGRIASELKREIEEDYKIELQLFDLGSFWLFRVLSHGYRVENYLWKQNKIQQINYDDRTDIPKRDERNKKYVDLVDELISKRQYLIVPVCEVEWT